MGRSKDPLNLNYDFRDPESFGVNTRRKIQPTIEIPSQFTLIFHVIWSLYHYNTWTRKRYLEVTQFKHSHG